MREILDLSRDEAERLLKRLTHHAFCKMRPLTWRGAVEKFKIAHLAIGSYADDGDEALEAYQDWESPWMVTVAADFERLQREAM